MKKKIVDNRFARDKDGYKDIINEIDRSGKCPFCKENFKYHKKPILHRIGMWFITENSWPYENTEHHFILIGDEHKESFTQLTTEDLTTVQSLMNWAIEEYKILGGGIALRFGDTSHTGSTVCHIHFHLIVPKMNATTGIVDTVQFPFG